MNEIEPYQENITTKHLLSQLWQAKWFMFVFVLLFSILASLYYVTATPLFKVTMMIAPAETAETRFGGSSFNTDNGMGQSYGLSGQHGVPLTFYNFTHIVTGPSVAKILMQDEGIVKTLNQYHRRAITTPEGLSDYLTQKVKISPVGETPLKRLTIYHADPDFGVALLRKMHLVADHIIQKEDKEKAEKRINYLRKNLREILNPDHRKALAELLIQQEHIFMLTSLDDAYAATVIEPPNRSADKHWPSLYLLLAFAIGAGLLIGYLIWWGRYAGKENG